MEKLTKVSHKIAEVMYQTAASQAPQDPGAGAGPGGDPGPTASSGGSAKPKDDGVIDAEFEENKD
jgi:molecular chaperone DnaK